MAYEEYIQVISDNLKIKNHELYFKSNDDYRGILEHVSIYEGYGYLNYIQKNYPDIFDKHKNEIIKICNDNDFYGKPLKETFDNFCVCSPTNLRYILHGFSILNFMKNNNLNEVDIVEIGGGYGGLALFIFNISKYFNIKIKSYTIFDLKEPCELQKRYLKLFDIDINSYTIEDEFVLNKDSFLVSNYAFSEISKELQEQYSEKIINPYINYGFLVWNFIKLYRFIKDKNIYYEEEKPKTGSQNLYVYVKPL